MITVPTLAELDIEKFKNQLWREGQAEIVESIINTPKSNILLQAGTGAGKSIIAAGSILLGPKWDRTDYKAGRLPPQSSICTATLQLQAQYLNDFNDIAKEVKGRRNFDCLVEPIKADEARCTISDPQDCESYYTCSYYSQIRQAENSPITIHSYAMALTSMNYAGRFRQQSFLVLDEAHLIDEMLMSFISATVSRYAAKLFDVPVPREGINWSWEGWKSWAEAYIEQVESMVDGMAGDIYSNVETRKRYSTGKSLINTMELLLNDSIQWLVVPDATGWDFMPVWVGPLAHSNLYRHGHKRLFMSATILNPKLFAKLIGLDPDDCLFLDAPSTFPIGSKPVYYDPVGNIKGGQPLEAYKDLVAKICATVKEHPGDKGLVHCVSYRLVQAIMLYAPADIKRRFITHDSQNRLLQYEIFKHSASDVVMLSPSMKEGISLDDEECRFVIITKIPYPYLGSPQVKARMDTPLGKEWYPWKTTCDLIQMTGRGMRSKDDWCSVYILDGNFERLFHQMQRYIPDYWQADLHDVQGRL